MLEDGKADSLSCRSVKRRLSAPFLRSRVLGRLLNDDDNDFFCCVVHSSVLNPAFSAAAQPRLMSGTEHRLGTPSPAHQAYGLHILNDAKLPFALGIMWPLLSSCALEVSADWTAISS